MNDERVVGVDDGLLRTLMRRSSWSMPTLRSDTNARSFHLDAHIRGALHALAQRSSSSGAGMPAATIAYLDLVEHARGRDDALDARAARGEGTLEHRLGGRRWPPRRRELSFDAGVDGVVEACSMVPKGTAMDLERTPGQDLTAAEALVEREGVDSLAPAAFLNPSGTLSMHRGILRLEALGHARDIAGAAPAVTADRPPPPRRPRRRP